MKASLENRFLDFIAQLPGAESIDRLPSPPLPPGKKAPKRADFLLNERRVIVEVKSLVKDTAVKMEQVLSKHRHRPEFPHFYGEWPLDQVLVRLPDGQEIMGEVVRKVTTAVEDHFEKADDQIGDTRGFLGADDA